MNSGHATATASPVRADHAVSRQVIEGRSKRRARGCGGGIAAKPARRHGARTSSQQKCAGPGLFRRPPPRTASNSPSRSTTSASSSWLAIPEELYVKNGRTRHLARAALKDLYPPEYQDRPPGNDDMGPDFLMMAKRIEPRATRRNRPHGKAGSSQSYFDFPRMRAMLTRRTIEQHASGNEYDTRQAMLAFLAARYIEWFRGDNA